MSISISAPDSHGNAVAIVLRNFPDECPICHTSLHPGYVSAIYSNAATPCVHVAFRCTKPPCGSLFIGIYRQAGDGRYDLTRTAPVTPLKQTFPKEIEEVSPVFVEIHNQSNVAESLQLHQLTGIGLRKALEFLVKDYAAHLKPQETGVIRAAPLAQCIQQYIDDPKVKQCAKLAAWLGNDETHYTRKWEDKDVTDLKLLIKLTVNWIESSMLTERYAAEMSKPK
jgi:hypothetical protein